MGAAERGKEGGKILEISVKFTYIRLLYFVEEGKLSFTVSFWFCFGCQKIRRLLEGVKYLEKFLPP